MAWDCREPVGAANRYPGYVEITPWSSGPKVSLKRWRVGSDGNPPLKGLRHNSPVSVPKKSGLLANLGGTAE
jgi:hypothetical protein